MCNMFTIDRGLCSDALPWSTATLRVFWEILGDPKLSSYEREEGRARDF